jgi:hypothetical protein
VHVVYPGKRFLGQACLDLEPRPLTGFEVSESGQEMVSLLHGLVKDLLATFPDVKETMGLTLVNVQYRLAANILH